MEALNTKQASENIENYAHVYFFFKKKSKFSWDDKTPRILNKLDWVVLQDVHAFGFHKWWHLKKLFLFWWIENEWKIRMNDKQAAE